MAFILVVASCEAAKLSVLYCFCPYNYERNYKLLWNIHGDLSGPSPGRQLMRPGRQAREYYSWDL